MAHSPSARRRALLRLGTALPFGLFASLAAAQASYPSKPVTIVVPYAPGGATDVVARVVATYLGPATKGTFKHVPYKGSGPALQDLMGGQIDMLITAAPAVASLTGKLRPLAVAKGKRLPILPNVPSAGEAGLPDFIISNWFGLAAPKGTPDTVIKVVSAAVGDVLKKPEVVDKIAAAGAEPLYLGPADAKNKVEGETLKWSTLIKKAGITNDNN